MRDSNQKEGYNIYTKKANNFYNNSKNGDYNNQVNQYTGQNVEYNVAEVEAKEDNSVAEVELNRGYNNIASTKENVSLSQGGYNVAQTQGNGYNAPFGKVGYNVAQTQGNGYNAPFGKGGYNVAEVAANDGYNNIALTQDKGYGTIGENNVFIANLEGVFAGSFKQLDETIRVTSEVMNLLQVSKENIECGIRTMREATDMLNAIGYICNKGSEKKI